MAVIKNALPGIVLLLGACAGPSEQAGPPSWQVLGLGGTACAEFLQRNDPTARALYGQWLLGYVTARNIQAPGVAQVIGRAELNTADFADRLDETPRTRIERYCARHPDAPFYAAADYAIALERQDLHRQDLRDFLERFERGHPDR